MILAGSEQMRRSPHESSFVLAIYNSQLETGLAAQGTGMVLDEVAQGIW